MAMPTPVESRPQTGKKSFERHHKVPVSVSKYSMHSNLQEGDNMSVRNNILN